MGSCGEEGRTFCGGICGTAFISAMRAGISHGIFASMKLGWAMALLLQLRQNKLSIVAGLVSMRQDVHRHPGLLFRYRFGPGN